MHFDLFHFENGSFDFHDLLPKCSLGMDLSICKIFFWEGNGFRNHVLGYDGRYIIIGSVPIVARLPHQLISELTHYQ